MQRVVSIVICRRVPVALSSPSVICEEVAGTFCASLLAPSHEPTVAPWHHGVVVSFDAVFVSFPCRLSLVRPPSPVSCLARAVSLHRAHVFAPAEALSSWSALGAMAVTST